jgi:hypothetical protein
MGRMVKDSGLRRVHCVVAIGERAQLHAGMRVSPFRRGDLRPAHRGPKRHAVMPVGRVEDAHVCEEPRGHKREHGLAEPAEARDNPLGGPNVDGGSQLRQGSTDSSTPTAERSRRLSWTPTLGS